MSRCPLGEETGDADMELTSVSPAPDPGLESNKCLVNYTDIATGIKTTRKCKKEKGGMWEAASGEPQCDLLTVGEENEFISSL